MSKVIFACVDNIFKSYDYNNIPIKNAILKKLSITDGLTGLFNHRYTIDALSRLVEENIRYRQPLSISMFDIDNFKKANDEYGHLFGDEVLVKISNSIESCLRKTDMVGR